jgi:predicted nucleotidyltransferase
MSPTATNTVLDALVAGVVREARPSRVILFGSRARGDARPDSDIDLLIVLPQPVADPWAMSAALRRAVGAIGVGKDFIITDEARFRERSRLVGTIEEIAAREGRVLHASA